MVEELVYWLFDVPEGKRGQSYVVEVH